MAGGLRAVFAGGPAHPRRDAALMHPILVDFGTYDIPGFGPTHMFLPTYGVLFAAGALAAWSWFVARAGRLDLPREPVFNLAFYTLLAGLVGAKLTLILVDLPYYLAHPMEVLGTIRSAGVLMGGVVAGAGAFLVYARRQKLPVAELGDAIAAPLVMAQGSGASGVSWRCCYGVVSDAWCAISACDAAARADRRSPEYAARSGAADQRVRLRWPCC